MRSLPAETEQEVLDEVSLTVLSGSVPKAGIVPDLCCRGDLNLLLYFSRRRRLWRKLWVIICERAVGCTYKGTIHSEELIPKFVNY